MIPTDGPAPIELIKRRRQDKQQNALLGICIAVKKTPLVTGGSAGFVSVLNCHGALGSKEMDRGKLCVN